MRAIHFFKGCVVNTKIIKLACAIGVSMVASSALADGKIGFVNTERILRDAAPSVRAIKKIEKEFEKRDTELQKMSKSLQSLQESLEKNAATLSDADRRNKEREARDLERDLQRKSREFREDMNQRRNEEFSAVLERATKAIKQVAEAEKLDVVFQDVVWASPRIDITDKVIKALADPPTGSSGSGAPSASPVAR
jgi:outer membrane protein